MVVEFHTFGSDSSGANQHLYGGSEYNPHYSYGYTSTHPEAQAALEAKAQEAARLMTLAEQQAKVPQPPTNKVLTTGITYSQAMAENAATALNQQVFGGRQGVIVQKVSETDYRVLLNPAIAPNDAATRARFETIIGNALEGYKQTSEYGTYERADGGGYRVSQRTPSAFSYSSEKGELEVSFASGEVVPYSQLSKADLTAFGPQIEAGKEAILLDINKQIGTEYSGMSYPRWEGGKLLNLPTQTTNQTPAWNIDYISEKPLTQKERATQLLFESGKQKTETSLPIYPTSAETEIFNEEGLSIIQHAEGLGMETIEIGQGGIPKITNVKFTGKVQPELFATETPGRITAEKISYRVEGGGIIGGGIADILGISSEVFSSQAGELYNLAEPHTFTGQLIKGVAGLEKGAEEYVSGWTNWKAQDSGIIGSGQEFAVRNVGGILSIGKDIFEVGAGVVTLPIAGAQVLELGGKGSEQEAAGFGSVIGYASSGLSNLPKDFIVLAPFDIAATKIASVLAPAAIPNMFGVTGMEAINTITPSSIKLLATTEQAIPGAVSLSGGGALSSALYKTTTNVLTHQPLETGIIEATATGAAGGLLLAGLGRAARPVMESIGKVIPLKTEIELRPANEIIRTSEWEGTTAEIFGGGTVKTTLELGNVKIPVGTATIKSIHGEVGFYQTSEYGTAYAGEQVTHFTGVSKPIISQLKGVIKSKTLETFNLGSFGRPDVFTAEGAGLPTMVEGKFVGGANYGKFAGSVYHEFEKGMETPTRAYMMLQGFKEMENLGGTGEEYLISGGKVEDVGRRYLSQTTATQFEDMGQIKAEVTEAFGAGVGLETIKEIKPEVMNIKKTIFGYEAERQVAESKPMPIETQATTRMYFTEAFEKPTKLIIHEGEAAGIYEGGPEPLAKSYLLEKELSKKSALGKVISKGEKPLSIEPTTERPTWARQLSKQITKEEELIIPTEALKTKAIEKAGESIILKRMAQSTAQKGMQLGMASSVKAAHLNMAQVRPQPSFMEQPHALGITERPSLQLENKVEYAVERYTSKYKPRVANLTKANITEWQTNRQAERPLERAIERPLERIIQPNKPAERIIERPLERLTNRSLERTAERAAERTTTRSLERITERMVERTTPRQVERQVEFTVTKTPPPIITKITFQSAPGGYLQPSAKKPLFIKPVKQVKDVRSLYADLISVAQTEAVLGAGMARQPSILKHPELWKKEQGRIPTAQQLSGQVKSKGSLSNMFKKQNGGRFL